MKMKFYKTVQFLSVVFCLLLGSCDPFKVTDPHDPRFDPMKFEYWDYSNSKELIDVFRFLFPQGTPITYVDKVLVDVGNGKRVILTMPVSLGLNLDKRLNLPLLKNDSKIIAMYFPKSDNPSLFADPKFVWSIIVFYDKNDRVLQIICGDELLIEDVIKK